MSESEAGLPEQTDVPEEHDLTGEPAEPEASEKPTVTFVSPSTTIAGFTFGHTRPSEG